MRSHAIRQNVKLNDMDPQGEHRGKCPFADAHKGCYILCHIYKGCHGWSMIYLVESSPGDFLVLIALRVGLLR